MENNSDKSPLVQGLIDYFEQTPKEVLDAELAELERFNGFGPVIEVLPNRIKVENKCEKLNGNMRVGDAWFEYTTFLNDELGIDGKYLCLCVVTDIRREDEGSTDFEYKQYVMGGDGCLYHVATLPCDGMDKEFGEVSYYTDFGIISRELGLLKHLLETEHENGYKVHAYHEVMEIIKFWLDMFKHNGGWCYADVVEMLNKC